MDENLLAALIIVMSINVIMFLAQMAIITPETGGGLGGHNIFYNCSGTLLSQFDENQCRGNVRILSNDNPAGNLPSNDPVQAGDGSLFTDMFNSIKGFFTNTLGLGYLTAMLSAPYNILKAVLPASLDAFAWAIAAMWYGITLLLVVAFFWGR